MQNTPNPKCTRCKCYWKPDETDIKSSGLVCKTCKKCRENSNKYSQNNPEYAKKWREYNCDEIRENKKKYYKENADEIREKKKKYYVNNCDEIKENAKKYREDNRDEIKERNKKYYVNNADEIREKKKKYREKNINKIKEYKKKYHEETKCKHDKGYGICKICNIKLYLIYLQRSQLRRCLKYSSALFT